MTTCDLPDGGRLHYQSEGVGTAPVVLLHPGYTNSTFWDRERAQIARRTQAVTVDARTHGASSDGTGPFRHCDDLAVLLRELGGAPSILIGVSMGAATAIDTALEHPELVEALVISGAGPAEPTFDDPWALAILQRADMAIEAMDPQAWLTAMLEFVPGPMRTLDDVDPTVVTRIRGLHESFVRQHIRPGIVPPMLVANAWERLREIAVPVLGVVGALDGPDHRRMCRRAVESVQDGRGVVSVDGAAHYVNLEQTQRWDEVVDAFLDDLGLDR